MKSSSIRCIISAGPTREYFDPVRFLSNPSSGKMGYALAEASVNCGWETTLISGPVSLKVPIGLDYHRVGTASEMFEKIDFFFNQCDILIMTAAVMDYKPKEYSTNKLKKTGQSIVVELESVIDILKTVAAKKSNQLVVGFAAETIDIEKYAFKKLKEKNCDFVVANDVGKIGSGFESDTNTVSLVNQNGNIEIIGPNTKKFIATELINRFNLELIQNFKLRR